MSDISEHLKQVLNNLPSRVKLIAVSKTKPVEAIEEAYKVGQRVFGENRVQELVEKYEALPKDIEWHLIGHLQTNKVKYVAPFVAMIHGVESLRLLDTINKEGEKNGRVIPCLLQFHIAEEETKFGLDEAEAKELLESENYGRMKNIHIVGVMGMATFTEDRKQIRKEFHHLKTIFDDLKQNYFSHDPAFKELSMGMSGDYPIAVEEGSTMVRVGSSIFGYRN
ncbi:MULTISPECIES: YggS family pyridoxal phosphate-dependent enzyme [Sanguibacteroides]|uniref:Pyridoxal phosphate homeostasis protein n=1 Tax=Sanguibacteroides justesenii TaxID=1547597 RepID=A0AB34R3S7_9PORP|nr:MULTISPECIES: YggS family pyridoxal phosphate-dependent enzyme [Sanguibacteroides]KIO43661.1 alanine racemase [Sanguibacteroides justesenii]PXZ45089.1 YggS family pyridoxal phosphate-dependent enzyme [Sanguibacteroides justesenii]